MSAAGHSFLSKKTRALCICPKSQHFWERLLQLAKFCALGSDQLPKGTLPQFAWSGGAHCEGSERSKGSTGASYTTHKLPLLKPVHKSIEIYEINPWL